MIGVGIGGVAMVRASRWMGIGGFIMGRLGNGSDADGWKCTVKQARG